MTKKEYEELLSEGRILFEKIGDELNALSTEFIRRQPGRYRRNEDFDETCIALALYERLKK